MHRYEELEKLYYKKIIIKYVILFVAVIVLFVIGFFIYRSYYNKNIQTNKETVKKADKEIKKSPKRVKKTPKTVKKKIKPPTLKTPKVQKKSVNHIEKLHFILPNISNVSSKQQNISQKPNELKTKNKIKEIEINHTANISKINIIEKTPDLKTIIKRFYETKDFDLAVLISKIYFKKGNLKNAQIWALRANNINPSSYKSWILFADILLKEKKLKKAQEILKVYVESYGQNDIIEKKLRSINDK